jgi:DNA-3-methyladenine glycosylase
MCNRFSQAFFQQSALDLAPMLLGQVLIRQFNDGSQLRTIINETEAYCGEEDLACHASKGRTARTEIMYHEGGKVYVYLIYGMYWMLNVVCGFENDPQAVLIRGLDLANGPGRVGKLLQLDKSFYGEDLVSSSRMWLEKVEHKTHSYITEPRIGIDYAGPIWSQKPWRFTLER